MTDDHPFYGTPLHTFTTLPRPVVSGPTIAGAAGKLLDRAYAMHSGDIDGDWREAEALEAEAVVLLIEAEGLS